MENQTIEQNINVIKSAPKTSEALWSALSYCGAFVLLPVGIKKRSEFLNFHLRQGMLLLFTEMFSTAVFVVPIIGWLVGLIGWFVSCLFSLIGLVQALRKKTWSMPILSNLAIKIKLSLYK